jgi:hypothetical protein
MSTISNVKPFIGCEQLYIYDVTKDDSTDYTSANVLKVEPGLVSVSYNANTSVTSVHADNKKVESDTTQTPTASIQLHGLNEELEKKLYGKILSGGALLDGTVTPQIGVFYAINKSQGEWMIRQIMKATASRAEETVNGKKESTEFQQPTVNLDVLYSLNFKTYVREFHSTNPVFADMTMTEVLTALAANPDAEFTV